MLLLNCAAFVRSPFHIYNVPVALLKLLSDVFLLLLCDSFDTILHADHWVMDKLKKSAFDTNYIEDADRIKTAKNKLLMQMTHNPYHILRGLRT